MTTGEPDPHGRVAALDGVRGIAILLVLIGHAGSRNGIGSLGAAGVTLFFTLSGYLITGLLQKEIQRRGSVRLGRFYVRRLTRLGPPLLVMLLITAPLLRARWEAVVPAMTWTANYAHLLGLNINPYGHTWSLGVEEQFYLLWPLVLLGMVRLHANAVRVVGGLLLFLIAWRLLISAHGDLTYAYVSLETAGTAILGGCLVSLGRWRLSGRWAIVSLVGMAVVLGFVIEFSSASTMWMLVPVSVTPMTVLLVASAQDAAWLEARWLTFAGVTSYSLYLWHEPISRLLFDDFTPLGVAAGAVAGMVAYFCVEAPLMRWRSRSVGAVSPPVVERAAEEALRP